MVIVEAPTRSVDEDLEVIAAEDVDCHLRHVELATQALRHPDPGAVRQRLELFEGAIIVTIVRVPDMPADATHSEAECLARTVRRGLRRGHDPGAP